MLASLTRKELAQIIEEQTSGKLRLVFEIAWAYLPKAYVPKRNASSSTLNSHPIGLRNNGSGMKGTKPRCGIAVSYDAGPGSPLSGAGSTLRCSLHT